MGSETFGAFMVGLFFGVAGFTTILWATDNLPKHAYDAGAKDALNNRLQPIIHIEDEDTTITYKLQWP